MTDLEILDGLSAIISDVSGLEEDQVTLDQDFASLDIDSLSMVEIAVAAQDKFGVEIADEQLREFGTVQDVIAYVGRELRALASQGIQG